MKKLFLAIFDVIYSLKQPIKENKYSCKEGLLFSKTLLQETMYLY